MMAVEVFTFGPQFTLGYLGMPRRVAMYPPEWQVLNVFSTAAATVMGFGCLHAYMDASLADLPNPSVAGAIVTIGSPAFVES